MARLVDESGGCAFIDIFDIKKGDRIEEKVREGIEGCQELVALLTPWSVERNWVWTELSAAWALRKRYVGVLYGLTIEEIEKDHGGMACLASTNVVALDDFEDYLREVRERSRSGSDR